MKAVVHGGGEAQGHKSAIAPVFQVLLWAQQVLQCVREALGLEDPGPFNRPMRPDDGIHRAGHAVGVLRNGAGTLFELAGKAVMHAGKALLLGLAQVQVGKEFPDCNGGVAHPGVFNFAEPAHQSCQHLARYAVGH